MGTGFWSDEERTLFERGVIRHGWSRWNHISDTMFNHSRSHVQIKSHAQKVKPARRAYLEAERAKFVTAQRQSQYYKFPTGLEIVKGAEASVSETNKGERKPAYDQKIIPGASTVGQSGQANDLRALNLLVACTTEEMGEAESRPKLSRPQVKHTNVRQSPPSAADGTHNDTTRNLLLQAASYVEEQRAKMSLATPLETNKGDPKDSAVVLKGKRKRSPPKRDMDEEINTQETEESRSKRSPPNRDGITAPITGNTASPTREVLDWHRFKMSREEQSRNLTPGLRIKVLRELEGTGWYGAVIINVGSAGIEIKLDNGKTEWQDFPNVNIVVDNTSNRSHAPQALAQAEAFVPRTKPNDLPSAFLQLAMSEVSATEKEDWIKGLCSEWGISYVAQAGRTTAKEQRYYDLLLHSCRSEKTFRDLRDENDKLQTEHTLLQEETNRLKDMVGLLNTSLVKRNSEIEELRAQIEAAGGVVESEVSDQDGRHQTSSNDTQDDGCDESEEEGNAELDATKSEDISPEASTGANPDASHAADGSIDCSEDA